MSTMAHMLARLRGSRLEDVRSVLHTAATKHAEQGLHLEYLWQNVDEPEEILFLFRIDNPTLAKKFIERVHKEAIKQDPSVNLPLMTYLEEDTDRKPRKKLERTKR
jgi:hypothetical protein